MRSRPLLVDKAALMLKLKIIIALLGSVSSSGEFGPSILSLLRRNTSSTLSTLSFLNEPNVVNLANFPHYATVLPLMGGRSWAKSEEVIDIMGKESLSNTIPFKVIPPKDHGMMVVIQELQIPAFNTFNRSLLVIDDNGKIINCFSKLEFQIEDKSPVSVCGRTRNPGEARPSVIDGVGPRSFIVPEGKSITIRFIYRDHEIDASKVVAEQVPYYDMGYVFHGSIAFTAYRKCPHGPPYHDENSAKLWPCNIPRDDRQEVAACVREETFCDSVVNCGIHDTEQFAVDEKFCMERTDNMTNFSRENNIVADTFRLEEAIRTRFIYNPYGYGDMIIPMGSHSNSGNDINSFESTEKTVSHPAFIALVVVISIVCVVMLGILLRFCCKSCVGKSDLYGNSSNPEAVARFHENVRNRDTEASGRNPAAYRISMDNLFKPSDDLPPSYDDLFPEDRHKRCDSTSTNPNVTIIVRPDEYSNVLSTATPIYTIPDQLQQPSRPIIPTGTPIFTNESTYVNPAFVYNVEAHSNAENSNEARSSGSSNQNHPRIVA